MDESGGYHVSEISQTEKGKYGMFSHMWNLKNIAYKQNNKTETNS